ncbi:universal stress protein [Streptomyces megasporus]|uniref:universal stress protein n=1 Tax=Streptomyces megasporus TaxID=44060 RepID=UPI0004E28242|nr:universal stress protein [Streptomyces megasporus]
MARTVTVGVDGSGESLAAADWAAREALRREVPLRLVHVREPDPFTPPASFADPETREHWARRIPRDAANDLAARHPGLEIVTDQLTGHAAAVLTDVAKDAELLVIGTRGLGVVAGFLVGSVALSTVARVPCPVVLVRAGTTDEHARKEGVGDAADHGPYRDVVLGAELYRPSDELFAFAFDVAARRGAALRVVHGWNPPLVYGIDPVAVDPRMATELAEESARTLRDALRPWRERHPDVEVRAEAVVGRPARLLLEAAKDASLVVVGRRKRRSPVGFRVGPITHAVMQHAPAPVAVVPYD